MDLSKVDWGKVKQEVLQEQLAMLDGYPAEKTGVTENMIKMTVNIIISVTPVFSAG